LLNNSSNHFGLHSLAQRLLPDDGLASAVECDGCR
jgi:hypothetical protein